MADRYQDRPFPAHDDDGRGADPHGQGKGESDPLAELARLIGQTDPFAMGRANVKSQPQPAQRSQYQPQQYEEPQYESEEYEPEPEAPAGPPLRAGYAVVKSATNSGIECVGLEDSFDGLLEMGRSRVLTPRDVTGILRLGGTILGTVNRGNPFGALIETSDGTRHYADRVIEMFHKTELGALVAPSTEGDANALADLKAFRIWTELGDSTGDFVTPTTRSAA
jgi:hypothetical protein